jgi:uncharacterized membrane protein YgcG
MNTQKYLKNYIMIVLLSLTMAAGTLQPAAAGAAPWEAGQKMTLTLDLNNPSEASAFSLYQVESWTDSGWEKTEDFRKMTDDPLEELSESGGIPSAAELVQESGELQSYIIQHKIEPDRTGTTVQGRLTFDQLPAGLYLVEQQADAGNTITVTENPYLVQLPSRNADGSGYLYDVVSIPKYRSIPETESGESSGDGGTEIESTESGGGETSDSGGGSHVSTLPETFPEETSPSPSDSEKMSSDEISSEETSPQPVQETTAPQESTRYVPELDISYPIKPDGTPDVPPENRYDSILDLPDNVNFDEMIALGDGYFYDPVTNELYFIGDQAVPLSRMGGDPGVLAKMGDTSIPSTILAVIAVISGTGCIYLYRKRKAYEKK